VIAPAAIALAGAVDEGFFRDRSSDTLACEARPDEVFCFGWARENIDRFLTPTLEHLEMVVASVAAGFVVAFALALLAHRRGWLRPPLLAATGVLYTIPSLALFFLLLPLTGLGRTTAIVVLAAYTLQIIYRNTIIGLANVPAATKDAARGMGYTERQVLWRVELPLALPEIVAGLRVATVSTVALATLAVFVGAGGLGTQIYGGGNLTFPTSVLIAAAIVILMALVLEAALLLAQRRLTPWRRARAS